MNGHILSVKNQHGKTLDPESPDYKWVDAGPIVWSDGVEDSNAIDPGVFRDPTNGTLWR